MIRPIWYVFGRFVFLLAVLVVFAASGHNALAEAKKGGTLRAYASDYRTLNPAVQSGTGTGIPGSQLFAGLVLIDADFQPQPYLAESWDLAEDGLSYTFRLVDNATFHDGKPVTSEDVAFSVDVVKNNHPFGPAMFGNVTAVETPDPQTAVFRLSKPTPGLMLSLQPLLMPVMPKHVYGDGQDLKTHPRNMQDIVGSGPFILSENKPGERLVLSRNENFFVEGTPYLDRIVFQNIGDPLTLLLMLEKGDIDLAGFSGMQPRDIARLEKVDGVEITEEGYGAIGYVIYLEMNLRKKPFDDVRVRQALYHALDTKFIADVLFSGRSKVGTGPLHTASAFYTGDVMRYEPDLEKAGALLDEAGYPADADGKRFSFVLDVPNWDPPNHGPISQYVRPQLAKLGIDVELRRAPDFGTWASRLSNFEYDASINGSFNYPDPTIGVHRHFQCSNIRNVIWSNTQGYCDESVDKIMSDAAVELDPEKRKALYAELQKKVAEDAVFIYFPENYTTTVYRDNVKNAPVEAFGPIAPWHEIYLEQ